MKKNIFSLSLLLLLLFFSSSAFAQTDLTGATVTLTPNSYDYDGTAHYPKVSGIRKGTKRYNSLVEGVDYDISYENYIEAGQGTATLVFKGDYTGTATSSFTINPMNLTTEESVILHLAVDEVDYDGTEQKPAVSDLYYGEKLLAPNVDYDISYQNNTNVGTASVTASFKGNYTGTKTAEFTIKDAGTVPPSYLTVKYYDRSETTPQVEKNMTYPEFLTLLESFPNAIAIAPQGFDVWPLDKDHVAMAGGEQNNITFGRFTFMDERDFYYSDPFTVKSLSYSRELVEGYNTCCLPFAVGIADLPEGTKMYGLNVEEEFNDVLIFTPIESADAGTPFLIVSPDACTWNVILSDAMVEPTITNSSAENTVFVGTYILTDEYEYSDNNPYYGLSDSEDQFMPLENTLSPFRACLLIKRHSSQPSLAFNIILSDADIIDMIRQEMEKTVKILSVYGGILSSEEVTPAVIAVNDAILLLTRHDNGEAIPSDEALEMYLRLKAITNMFSDVVTGISGVNEYVNDNHYYNLRGLRVAQPSKGIYILNGKKVLVK